MRLHDSKYSDKSQLTALLWHFSRTLYLPPPKRCTRLEAISTKPSSPQFKRMPTALWVSCSNTFQATAHSEQYTRSTGAPTSAYELTWSFASSVTMSQRRANPFPIIHGVAMQVHLPQRLVKQARLKARTLLLLLLVLLHHPTLV